MAWHPKHYRINLSISEGATFPLWLATTKTNQCCPAILLIMFFAHKIPPPRPREKERERERGLDRLVRTSCELSERSTVQFKQLQQQHQLPLPLQPAYYCKLCNAASRSDSARPSLIERKRQIEIERWKDIDHQVGDLHLYQSSLSLSLSLKSVRNESINEFGPIPNLASDSRGCARRLENVFGSPMANGSLRHQFALFASVREGARQMQAAQ